MKQNLLPQLGLLVAAATISTFTACTSGTAIQKEAAADAVPKESEAAAPATTAPKTAKVEEPKETPPAPVKSWEETYAGLLKKYVTPSGVRYAAWKANPADVAAQKSVTDAIAAATAPSGSEQERLAFYMNAYNAWILQRVLDDYPVKGVGGGNALGRGLFFAGKNITVAGQKTSFNDLENDIIRGKFDEARIHFAINCASAGCPPLNAEPFRAATLDATLDRLTRKFVNENPEGVRKTTDGAYSLSEIFTWFEDDFAGGQVITFINRYRNEPIPADAKIEYHDYDWSLNGVN